MTGLAPKLLRRGWIAGTALALGLGLAACGNKQSRPTVANADNNGAYLWAGNVTYQLQVSRELNPFAPEDHSYLLGVSSPPLTASQAWYGVFLWAKNQTNTPQTTSNSFYIMDTQGNRYNPIPINPAVNPYAWTARTLLPKGTEPGVGTMAYYAPTGGGELLFKLNDSAYANRPLTLYIVAAGQAEPSQISLDL
jgi:hypothetical protein